MNSLIPDLYGPMHKSMGLLIADLIGSVAGGSPAVVDNWTRIQSAWRRIEILSEQHERAERLHLAPMLVIAAPALAAELEARHVGLASARTRAAGAFAKAVVADCLDLCIAAKLETLDAVAAFVAGSLQHLEIERDQATCAILTMFAPPALFAAARAISVTLPSETRALAFPMIAQSELAELSDPFLRLIRTRPEPETLAVEASRAFAHARREISASLELSRAA